MSVSYSEQVLKLFHWQKWLLNVAFYFSAVPPVCDQQKGLVFGFYEHPSPILKVIFLQSIWKGRTRLMCPSWYWHQKITLYWLTIDENLKKMYLKQWSSCNPLDMLRVHQFIIVLPGTNKNQNQHMCAVKTELPNWEAGSMRYEFCALRCGLGSANRRRSLARCADLKSEERNEERNERGQRRQQIQILIQNRQLQHE